MIGNQGDALSSFRLFRDGIALRGDGLAGHDGCCEGGGVWKGAVYDLAVVQSLVEMGLDRGACCAGGFDQTELQGGGHVAVVRSGAGEERLGQFEGRKCHGFQGRAHGLEETRLEAVLQGEAGFLGLMGQGGQAFMGGVAIDRQRFGREGLFGTEMGIASFQSGGKVEDVIDERAVANAGL